MNLAAKSQFHASLQPSRIAGWTHAVLCAAGIVMAALFVSITIADVHPYPLFLAAIL